MKTKTLVKLLIASSLFIIISVSIVLACAGGDEYWFGYSNFAPEPHADESYTPLFYDEYNMFYDIMYDGGYIDRFNDEIVKDWKGYLAGNMSDANITTLLFDEKSEKIIDDLYAFETKKVKIGNYNEWNTKTRLDNNEVKSFIEFLYLAKQIQKSSINTFDPWDYENTEKPEAVGSGLINLVKNKYQSESNPFLKDRYWFQTMKAYFYSDISQDANSFFEKTRNEVPKNTLYYRAMSYLAGIAKNRKIIHNRIICTALFLRNAFQCAPQQPIVFTQQTKMN